MESTSPPENPSTGDSSLLGHAPLRRLPATGSGTKSKYVGSFHFLWLLNASLFGQFGCSHPPFFVLYCFC